MTGTLSFLTVCHALAISGAMALQLGGRGWKWFPLAIAPSLALWIVGAVRRDAFPEEEAS